METCAPSLWGWHFAEHLAGAREVELAFGLQLAQSGQNKVSAIDIGRHGGEAIG